MQVFELQRDLFTRPFLLFELASQDLSVRLLASNEIPANKLR